MDGGREGPPSVSVSVHACACEERLLSFFLSFFLLRLRLDSKFVLSTLSAYVVCLSPEGCVLRAGAQGRLPRHWLHFWGDGERKEEEGKRIQGRRSRGMGQGLKGTFEQQVSSRSVIVNWATCKVRRGENTAEKRNNGEGQFFYFSRGALTLVLSFSVLI